MPYLTLKTLTTVSPQTASPSVCPEKQPGTFTFNFSIESIVIFAIVCLMFGWLTFRKRRVHYDILQQQREMLERVWKIGSSK